MMKQLNKISPSHIRHMKIFMSFVFIFSLILSNYANAETNCFITSENNCIIRSEGECDKSYTPASTFKIAISLMGFDSVILVDETHPTWDFKSGYVDWLERWKQPHNPKLWLANSCVWYSQIITQKLGMKRFTEYTKLLNYGNQDTSGDKGMNNGLSNCWLSSSLSISPQEQINFLNKLVTNTLPVSVDAQEKTKNIMYQETLPSGWELYGKTGNGSQLDADDNKIKDRQVGWFVGFVKKDKKIITFVQLIADDSKQKTYASLRAKAALKKNIGKIISDDLISQNNIILHDSKHERIIPIAIYSNKENSKNHQLPVVIINHGYGVKNTEYSFIASNLAAKGYYVISIQHDLDGDPALPRTGNLYELRMPFWERGVKSLSFAIEKISKDNSKLNMSKVILIGHSNGGDISMMFADKYPNKVKKVISLDSLRYPFPTGSNILSLRAKDTSADIGVLTKNTNAEIIQMNNAKHIDMYDAGPNDVKAEIIEHINDFLQK
jgi:beta-lactamase class D/predicted esterase